VKVKQLGFGSLTLRIQDSGECGYVSGGSRMLSTKRLIPHRDRSACQHLGARVPSACKLDPAKIVIETRQLRLRVTSVTGDRDRPFGESF
jgi:hypothetical protein